MCSALNVLRRVHPSWYAHSPTGPKSASTHAPSADVAGFTSDGDTVTQPGGIHPFAPVARAC